MTMERLYSNYRADKSCRLTNPITYRIIKLSNSSNFVRTKVKSNFGHSAKPVTRKNERNEDRDRLFLLFVLLRELCSIISGIRLKKVSQNYIILFYGTGILKVTVYLFFSWIIFFCNIICILNIFIYAKIYMNLMLIRMKVEFKSFFYSN